MMCASGYARKRKFFRAIVGVCTCFVLILFAFSWYYGLSPHKTGYEAGMFLGRWVFEELYDDDLHFVDTTVRTYWIAPKGVAPLADPVESWNMLQRVNPALNVEYIPPPPGLHSMPPFVYEKIDSPQLRTLIERYDLPAIIAAPTEYESMLKLGAWIGTRWDHGVDAVPGGNSCLMVSEIIEAGKQGRKFWCEIAAKVTVQAATAVGWPARLVTGSRDGYAEDHGVAELWSNQFNKWFVLDTDFNVVMESNGIPLSAFELCHYGEQLQREHKLEVKHFAEPKKSLPYADLVPYYSFVSIDLRNDWFSRKLRKGSPAGGERATWYTTRPSMKPILTRKVRVDDRELFNWKVNDTFLYLQQQNESAKGRILTIALAGYSPYFDFFQVRKGGQEWTTLKGTKWVVSQKDGERCRLEARLVGAGWTGPVTTVVIHTRKQG